MTLEALELCGRSQGMLAATELEKAGNRGPLSELPEGTSRGSTALSAPRLQPSDTGVRFLASKTMREQISVVLSRQICYICNEKLIQMLSMICL